MPRTLRVVSLHRSADTVYISVVLDGVPYEASVTRAALQAAPNKSAKITLLVEAVQAVEAARTGGEYAALLGALEVP